MRVLTIVCFFELQLLHGTWFSEAEVREDKWLGMGDLVCGLLLGVRWIVSFLSESRICYFCR